jgi:hypothetical protein
LISDIESTDSDLSDDYDEAYLNYIHHNDSGYVSDASDTPLFIVSCPNECILSYSDIID